MFYPGPNDVQLQRQSVIFAGACASCVYWLGASALGGHPDGAILGFGSTMFAIWATTENETRKRAVRRQRTDEHDKVDPGSHPQSEEGHKR